MKFKSHLPLCFFNFPILALEHLGKYDDTTINVLFIELLANEDTTGDYQLINLQVMGPATFCPPFKINAGFSERVSFIEVSGEECLFPRSVCGIESTARANPDMQIYVYINTNKAVKSQKHYVVKKPGRIRSCRVTELLYKFPNVHFVREDLLSYFHQSKFASLYESGLLNQSSWSYVHLSDALRHILLYQYGGFYLDSGKAILRGNTKTSILINSNRFIFWQILSLSDHFTVYETACLI